MMNTLLKTGSLGLAGLVATGLVAWQAPVAVARDDDRGHQSTKAFKRDDDSQSAVTTVDDDDDDDTGFGQKGTQTRTRTGRGGDGTNTDTNTDTRGRDDSRGTRTRDRTHDGPGRDRVDHSRHHTNDGTRHNTRG